MCFCRHTKLSLTTGSIKPTICSVFRHRRIMKSFLVACLIGVAVSKPANISDARPQSDTKSKLDSPTNANIKLALFKDILGAKKNLKRTSAVSSISPRDLIGKNSEQQEKSTVPPISPREVLTCGSHSLERGTYTLESVNHPNNYINNYDCNYYITSSESSEIEFQCSAFNIEQHSSCDWDYVQFNGVKYCGTTAPPSGSYASVTFNFHTDYSVVRTGFSCTLTVRGGSDKLECGTHNLDIGQYGIESPNHPENYDNYYDCSYDLQANNAEHSVSVSCLAFNVEANTQCSWDWFSVNGQKFCGTSGPSDVSSIGSMQIVFHTDYSVTRSGYSCTITVSADSGGGGGSNGACTCGIPNRSSRIVGGEETEVYEYPWQVGLVCAGGTSTICGGTLISDRYVLTAAHCTFGDQPSDIEVLLKEHLINNNDGQIRVSIADIINHPSYTSASGSGYDVSLLKLSEPVEFPNDNTLAPACLPVDAHNTYENVDAIVTGWGLTSQGGSQATTLQEVTVPVISNEACSSSYSSINPTMICAGLSEGGKDACMGDSGGPMVTLTGDRYTLIGVVSWGRGCALPGYPGVYARVTSVLSWIQSHTAQSTYCE